MTVAGQETGFDTLEERSFDEVWEIAGRQSLSRHIQYAFANSRFWKEKWLESGISERELTGETHLQQLPFAEKEELLADQANCPPFGRLLAVPLAMVRRVHQTSGTTARPFYIALTEKDIANTVVAGARALRCAGVVAGDVVFHCLNYCLWSGGLTDHLCLESTGATVVPFGVGNSQLLLETMFRLRATAISCTPTYLNTLAALLREKFNRQPRELGLKKAILGGEAGLQNPAFRASLENLWGLKAIDANYGASEVLSIFGAECAMRQGLHWHGQGIIHVELVNPQTLQVVPLRTGAIGEFVFTSLVREGQPLFRLRSHDMVKVVDSEPCVCGRWGFRFQVLGRSDNMLIVKGINIFPESLHELLARFPDKLTGEYRVIVRRPEPIERLDVQVEARSALVGAARDDFGRELAGLVRQMHSVRIAIEWFEEGSFPRGEGKTQRLIKAI